MNGVISPSDPLSREVGLESDDDDENILFDLTNLLVRFSYSGSTNINENFNVEGDKHDNDCVILKRNSNQRNAPVLHNSELSNDETRVSESSGSRKGYVENSITDKTVTVNSLSKFYIDLKVHTLYPVCFLINSGSAVMP